MQVREKYSDDPQISRIVDAAGRELDAIVAAKLARQVILLAAPPISFNSFRHFTLPCYSTTVLLYYRTTALP